MHNLDQLLVTIERGFKDRKRLLRSGGLELGSESRSLPIASSKKPGLIDLTAISARYLRRDIPLGQYIREMRSLLPAQYHDLILGYYFSGRYVSDPISLLEQTIGDDGEISVLAQTLVLSQRVDNPRLIEAIERELAKLIAELFRFRNVTSAIREYDTFFELVSGDIGPSGSVRTLSDFNQSIGEIKGTLVPLLGPDIFTVFQELCDPDTPLSKDLVRRNLKIGANWKCSDLIGKILIVRATRNSVGDDLPLRIALDQTANHSRLMPASKRIFDAWSSGSPPDQKKSDSTLSHVTCSPICPRL